jgi:hypothetical protein
MASLAAALKPWIRFAQAIGALTRAEGEALWHRCWTALMHVSDHQQRFQDASEPTQHFLI